MNKIKRALFAIVAVAMASLGFPLPAKAQLAALRTITFPVVGTVTYGNDFGDPRDGGARTHEGIDILGKKNAVACRRC